MTHHTESFRVRVSASGEMKMFTILSLTFLLLAFETSGSFSGDAVNYVKTPCKRDSENLNQCIAGVWEILRPNTAAGIPKYGIPPLEPLILPALKVDKKSDLLSIKATVNPLTITGVSRAKINVLNVLLKDLSGSLSLTIANMNVSAPYVLDALIMKITSVKGRGQFHGRISNVKVNLKTKAELSSKNEQGKSYLKLKSLKIKLHVGDAKVRLKDTTKNFQSRIATEAAVVFYDNNRRAVLDMLTPTIEEYTESVVLDILNSVFSSTAYEDMLH